jgi:hypothetical protein
MPDKLFLITGREASETTRLQHSYKVETDVYLLSDAKITECTLL